MLGRFIIWRNLNTGSYYFKYVKGNYYDYKIGLVNQYNHEVILVINISDYISSRYSTLSYRKRVISSLIKFLKKFE